MLAARVGGMTRRRWQRLRMVAGNREGVAHTRISVTPARGSSSVLSSALAALAFMLSAGIDQRDARPAAVRGQRQLRGSSRTCSTRMYFESSMRNELDEIRMLFASQNLAITALTARRLRVAAQSQLRGEVRERLAAGAALIMNQQAGRKAVRSSRAAQLLDLRREPRRLQCGRHNHVGSDHRGSRAAARSQLRSQRPRSRPARGYARVRRAPVSR